MPPVVASTYGRFQDSFSLVAIVISSDDKKEVVSKLTQPLIFVHPQGLEPWTH